MTANADVQSANTVGFTTINLEAGKWYMLAPQFEEVGKGSVEMVDLLKTMTCKGLISYTYGQKSKASQIQVFNPATGGYTYYYYCKSGTPSVEQWRASAGVPTSFPITYGTAVWLHVTDVDPDGASITFNGQVKEGSFVQNVGGENGTWKIIANPFPTDLTIGMIKTEGIESKTYGQKASASQIQVYNPETKGYSYFYYCKSGTPSVEQWRSSAGVPADTTVVAKIGEGFWIKALTPGTLTFTLK